MQHKQAATTKRKVRSLSLLVIHPAYSTVKQVKSVWGQETACVCVLRRHNPTHAHTRTQHDTADATTCSVPCRAVPCCAMLCHALRELLCELLTHRPRHKATSKHQGPHPPPAYTHADRAPTRLGLSPLLCLTSLAQQATKERPQKRRRPQRACLAATDYNSSMPCC